MLWLVLKLTGSALITGTVLVLVIPLLNSLDALTLPALYLISFLLATFGQLFRPALMASLPNIMSSEALMPANALMGRPAGRPCAQSAGRVNQDGFSARMASSTPWCRGTTASMWVSSRTRRIRARAGTTSCKC